MRIELMTFACGSEAPRADSIVSSVRPYVINISELTLQPLNPSIKIVESPNIAVTSVLADYGPQGLILGLPPGGMQKGIPNIHKR